MTLKSIDTQLSISRSLETGQLQKQLNQKPLEDQLSLASSQLKKQEQLRSKTENLERKAQSTIHEDDSQPNSQSHQQEQRRDQTSEETPHKPEHPYKGHHIDFSC